MASFIRPAPRLPPTTATTRRSHVARRRDGGDLGPDRVAGDDRAPQRRARERHRGPGAEAHRDAVREPGCAFCSCTTTGIRSTRGRDHRGQRRVRHRRRRRPRARTGARCANARHERDRVSHAARTFWSIARGVQAAPQPAPGQQLDRVPGRRHRGRLEPAAGADEADRVARVPARDQLVGEREGRVHVTTGTAAGDEREGCVRRRAGSRRGPAPLARRRWRGSPTRAS